LLGLFLISFSSAAITTTLNSPADASISSIPTISFKATANVTSGVGIANMSLFTNSSGSWAIGNTSTSLVLNQTSYYRLDGSTGDIIDSYGSNNGTNYGTTRGVTGIISDSFYFNGGSSNWASLNTSSISTGLEKTINFWTNASTSQDSYAQIVGDRGAAGDFTAFIRNGPLSTINFNVGSGTAATISQSLIMDNEWHMVTGVVLANGTTYFYIDGFLESTGSGATTTSGDWKLGHNPSDDDYYTGGLDEIGFFDEALNQSSINTLYSSGNATRPGQPKSKTQTWSRTISGTTLWNVQVCNVDGDCTFSTSNYTINLETALPTILVETPTSILNHNYINGTETLNVTFTDTNLDSCWYNYNGTNITIEGCLTGVKNSTTFTLESENTNMTIYANDTAGNENSSFIEWDYKLLEQELTYDEDITEGELNVFTDKVLVADGYQISSAILNYNGVNYSTSISYSSGEYVISSSQYAPLVSSDTNVTFGFYITIDEVTYNPSTNNQTIYDLVFAICGGVTNDTLLNIYLKNELTKAALTGDIEVSIDIISKSSGLTVETLNNNFENTTSGSVCFSPNSSYDLYYLDAEIRYVSDGYAPEFYFIQKADMGDYPANLSLYDLNLNSSTEFLIKYQDDSLITVEGAVIQLMRKYISEDAYEVVEAPLTSNIGTAIVHIDLDTNLYKAIVVKDGVILDVFDNLVFNCENELSGICTENLFGEIDPQNSVDMDVINDFSYLITSVNNTVTTTFSIPSGTPAITNIVLKQKDTFGNNYLCNQTITSSAGSIDCTYNDTIGDSMLYLYIYKNGELRAYSSYFITEAGAVDWLGNNFFIVFILLLSIVGMAMASPEWMIINSVATMVLCGGIWLLAGLDFVAGLGTLIWLLVSAVILIFKISKQEDR